ATNSFSYGKKLSGWEFIFCEFVNKSVQLFQPNQPIAFLGKASDHFPHWLLHWLKFRFHNFKIIHSAMTRTEIICGFARCLEFFAATIFYTSPAPAAAMHFGKCRISDKKLLEIRCRS